MACNMAEEARAREDGLDVVNHMKEIEVVLRANTDTSNTATQGFTA